MKNNKYDLTTIEGLTKAIIEGVNNANSLDEAMEVASNTEKHLRDMDSKDRKAVMDNLKGYAKEQLEDIINKDMIKKANEFTKELGLDMPESLIEEIVSSITKDRLSDIASEILEEEFNNSVKIEKKSILANENEDMILLVPQFLPSMEELPAILSEIRKDFGRGLKGVLAKDKIIILEYENNKDIVFGIEDKYLEGLTLKEYGKQVFKALEEYVEIEEVFGSMEDKIKEFMKIARNR